MMTLENDDYYKKGLDIPSFHVMRCEERLPGLDVEVPATALLACTVFTRVAGVKVEGEETREVPATWR